MFMDPMNSDTLSDPAERPTGGFEDGSGWHGA